MTTEQKLIEAQENLKKALQLDWAFKNVNGKPNKIIIEGTPKGSYHTSYDKFTKEILDWHTKEKESALRELADLIKSKYFNVSPEGSIDRKLEEVVTDNIHSVVDECLNQMIGGK